MPARDRWLALHLRVYRGLLVLYPPRFRRDFGPAMVQLFTDQLRHPRRAGPAVAARVWLRTLDDLLAGVPRQQWEAFMDVSSPVTRAAVAAGILAVVTALGTVLAVVAAGAGPAGPLAVLLAVVLLVCRRQLRAFLTPPQGLWYRLLLAGIGLCAAAVLAGLAYWSTHDTTSTLVLVLGNTALLLGVVLTVAGAAFGIAQLGQRARHSG